MKRQRGRGRKPGGGGGGGGNHGGNHGNRPLESNGPEVKIRGTAAQIYEKYMQYARDSQSGGDRVKYENYLQHAEHYFRIMAATMPRERMQQISDNGGQQNFDQNTQAPREQEDGSTTDPLKVIDEVDDGEGEADGEGDEIEARGDRPERAERPERVERQDRAERHERVERQDRDNDEGEGEAQAGEQGDREGRSRRRRRNRNRDRGEGGGQNGNGGDGEARSALDALAAKQGAL